MRNYSGKISNCLYWERWSNFKQNRFKSLEWKSNTSCALAFHVGSLFLGFPSLCVVIIVLFSCVTFDHWCIRSGDSWSVSALPHVLICQKFGQKPKKFGRNVQELWQRSFNIFNSTNEFIFVCYKFFLFIIETALHINVKSTISF